MASFEDDYIAVRTVPSVQRADRANRPAGRLLLVGAAMLLAFACSKERKPVAEGPLQAGSPATEPAPVSAAAKFEEAHFDLEMKATGTYQVGTAGHVDVVLNAKGEYKCNDEYPYKLKLEPSPGVKYPADVVTKDAVALEGKRAVMKVPFTPTEAGERVIAGKFSFSVCTEERCLIERRDLELAVPVQ